MDTMGNMSLQFSMARCGGGDDIGSMLQVAQTWRYLKSHKHLSNEKKPGWLGYKGDYTSQVGLL